MSSCALRCALRCFCGLAARPWRVEGSGAAAPNMAAAPIASRGSHQPWLGAAAKRQCTSTFKLLDMPTQILEDCDISIRSPSPNLCPLAIGNWNWGLSLSAGCQVPVTHLVPETAFISLGLIVRSGHQYPAYRFYERPYGSISDVRHALESPWPCDELERGPSSRRRCLPSFFATLIGHETSWEG